jgi:putative flavoprotein involved in K+ transport
MQETIAFIERYASLVSVSVRTHCPVTSVRSIGDGYQVVTQRGTWHCKAVVLATGAFNIAQVPKLSAELPSGIAQLNAAQYRSPEGLEAGGVMVVVAAAPGAQIADEPALRTSCDAGCGRARARPGCTAAATSSGGWTPRA